MPRNSRSREIYPISYRELYVEEIEDISPSMRRITLSGEQLQDHERDGISVPSLVSHGFDDDVRLIFPDPETGERPHPIAQNDGNLLWPEAVKNLFRTYTVRHFDAVRGRLAIDFARHGEGLAENWSQNARIGDAILWQARSRVHSYLRTPIGSSWPETRLRSQQSAAAWNHSRQGIARLRW